MNLRGLLPVILIGVLATTVSADEGWLIERFDIEYTIQRDGSIAAQEAIDVDFRGLSRHGIFRDMTRLLSYDESRNREYAIDLKSVTTPDGRRQPVKSTTEGPTQRFRIGDPDRTISGRIGYRLSYQVSGALNGFPDHDELYWNASGKWPVTMAAVSVHVTAPDNAINRVECYQGEEGSTERCVARLVPGGATFTSTRALHEGEQLTIVAALRKGVVAEPHPLLSNKPRDVLHAFDRTPIFVGVMLLGFAAAFGGVGTLWWRLGRDRRFVSLHYLSQTDQIETVPLFSPDSIVVEFEPPERMRPGEMGLLFDERADTLDVTATIVDLAVRGYLKITELPKTWILGRSDWQLDQLKKADDNLLDYERIILNGLFDTTESRKLSELKNKFYRDLARAKEALYKDGVDKGWFPKSPEKVRNLWRVLGYVAAGLGVWLTMEVGRRWGAGLVGLPVIAGGLLLALASRAMPRRTAAGREAMRRALGFARYIKTAEQQQQAFAERANIFTSYLPYAIAMKCVDRWARAFKDIDMQRATAAWYAGHSQFDPGHFSSSLGSFSSSVSSTIQSTPGGSGGSGFGGGSSGGGGGGGGGGGW